MQKANFCMTFAVLALLASGSLRAAAAELPDVARLKTMTARLAPVDIRTDVAALPENERRALARLIEAARRIDGLFLQQVAPRVTSDLLALADDQSDLGRARLHYFLINKGPWSELDENAPFLPGVGPRPAQANFYPPDATRGEIEQWIGALGEGERAAATGFFTTVRRNAAGKLEAIPYSREYQGELPELAGLLREAAQLTHQPTLRDFLEKRAAAFLSNDYYDSDIAWMALDATIEPTIGPYEVYNDEWFNYKAAFEAFITLTDSAESAKLARFGAELQGLQSHLPIEPRYRQGKLGAAAPIRVVNVVMSAGDGNRAVQSAAYNLPNDERVVAAKGSKRIMLKNLQEAKFQKVLMPIAAVALAPEDRKLVAFDPFFTHILMHELMHGLGPQTITVAGRETTVRQELKELNGTLEEAKADVSGLWALQQLMDKGVLERRQERAMYVTFLASTFRTLRFGLGEAHAKGMALQVNYLLDAGAIRQADDGTFTVDVARMKKGVTALTHDIMTLQAHGDYTGAKQLLDRMVKIRPQTQQILERLKDTPVDIAPRFVTAEELLAP